MKNFSRRLSCFIFGLALVLGVGVSFSSINGKAIESEAASGDVYTFSNTKGESSDGNWSFTTNQNDGSSAPAWNSNSSELRFYPKNDIAITGAKNCILNSVVFTCVFNVKSDVTITNWEADNGTITKFSNSLTTFSVSDINSTSLTVTFSGTKGNIGLKTVTVNYTSLGSKKLAEITVTGQKTEFNLGDAFEFGGTVKGKYEGDDSEYTITPKIDSSKVDMDCVGTYPVTVSFAGDVTDSFKPFEYTISVKNPYTGSGTKEDPYTVSDAYIIASNLPSGNNGKIVYVKGTVSTDVTYSTEYKSGTFDITDGTKTINAYSISGVQIADSTKEGFVAKEYEVVVSGAIIKFEKNGTVTYEVGYAKGYSASLVSSTAPKTTFKIVGAPTSNIEIGDSGTLSVDQDDLTVTWTSSNTSVLEITGNTYVAKAGGEATITAKDTASGKTVSVDVVVNYGLIEIAKVNELMATFDETYSKTKYYVTVKGYITDLDVDGKTRMIALSDKKVGEENGNTINVYGIYSDYEIRNTLILNGTMTFTGRPVTYKGDGQLTSVEYDESDYSDDAMTFAATFLKEIETPCENPNSDNTELLKPIWASLATKWGEIDSYSQAKLKNATSSNDDSNIVKMIAQYDHIVKKYGDKLGSGYNFMERSVTSNISHNVLNINETNNMIPLIVIVCLISVTLVGSLIIIRKRKVN